jgi:ABC-type amino acid transport substrate-binding protein
MLSSIAMAGAPVSRRVLLQAAISMFAAGGRAAAADAPLRLARIEGVPDQRVGSEILQVVYARIGQPVEFVDLPAKRALLESSSGRLDGEVQRVLDVATEYPTLLPVREAIMFIEPSVFSATMSPAIAGWDSIRPLSIGIARGVGSSERGTRGMPRVTAFTDMEQLMRMAASGRVDVAVNDRFSGELILRRLGLADRVRALTPPLQHIDLFHFVHERHRALVPRLEAAVREIRGSGELQRIRQDAMDRMLAEAR